jgi:hypothetical protein
MWLVKTDYKKSFRLQMNWKSGEENVPSNMGLVNRAVKMFGM